MKPRLVGLLALVSVAMLGCGPQGATETGNPEIWLALETSDSSEVAIAPESGAITVESLWLGLDEIEGQDCATGETILVMASPNAVDLVSGFGVDALANPPLARYCRLAIGLRPVSQQAGVPAELANNGFFMTGALSDGSSFEVWGDDIDYAEDLVPGDDPASLILSLDVSVLVTGLRVDQVAPDGDGVRRLDRTSAGGSNADLEVPLFSAFTVYEDLNANGVVDPEDAPIQ